jgi:hypothetical protein
MGCDFMKPWLRLSMVSPQYDPCLCERRKEPSCAIEQLRSRWGSCQNPTLLWNQFCNNDGSRARGHPELLPDAGDDRRSAVS